MTWFRWWHKFIRSNRKPIPENTAKEWTEKLSLGYAFLAWNVLGLVGYTVYKSYNTKHKLTSEEENVLSPGLRWAKESGRENAKVLRLSGFKLIPVDPNLPNAEHDHVVKE